METAIHSCYPGNRETAYEMRFLDVNHYDQVVELNSYILSDPKTELFLHPLPRSVLTQILSNHAGFGIGMFLNNEMAAYRLVYYPQKPSDLYLDYQDPDLSMELDIPANRLKYLARFAGVAVYPLHRNCRLATKMTETALGFLVQRGFHHAVVTCHPENHHSLRLLASFGFETVSFIRKEDGRHRLVLLNDLLQHNKSS